MSVELIGCAFSLRSTDDLKFESSVTAVISVGFLQNVGEQRGTSSDVSLSPQLCAEDRHQSHYMRQQRAFRGSAEDSHVGMCGAPSYGLRAVSRPLQCVQRLYTNIPILSPTFTFVASRQPPARCAEREYADPDNRLHGLVRGAPVDQILVPLDEAARKQGDDGRASVGEPAELVCALDRVAFLDGPANGPDQHYRV